MAIDSDHGAFVEKFLLRPPSSSHDLPLSGLTFAVKDIFDVAGRVTGFGNPDWARTHPPSSGCFRNIEWRCHKYWYNPRGLEDAVVEVP